MAAATSSSMKAPTPCGGLVDPRVLEATSNVFRAHGYLGSSVQQLVTATGRSRSALYRAYGDKAGLFSATLEWYVENHVSITVESGVSPARRALDDVLAAGGEHLPCLLVRSCLEIDDLPGSAADCVTRTMELQWAAIIDSEPIRDPERAGTAGLALRYGLILLAGAGVPTDMLYAASDLCPSQPGSIVHKS